MRIALKKVFASIQGEGRYVGTPAVFVRLAGCHLHCKFCDTKESWAFIEPNFCMHEVIELVRDELTRWPDVHMIIITGGEPLDQPEAFVDLFNELQKHFPQCSVMFETSGHVNWHSIPVRLQLLLETFGPKCMCLSPKPDFPPPSIMYQLADHVKVLVGANGLECPHSIEEIIIMRQRPEFYRHIYLQPVDYGEDTDRCGRANYNTVDEAMRHNLRVSVQIHKVLGCP